MNLTLQGTAMTATSPSIFSDPHALLEHLEPILGQTGSVKNAQEVQKLVSVMKGSEVLVSRCIILSIIKATRGPSTLDKFMEGGGWQVLNVWLAEAKRTQNNPMLVEILQVLHKLPVTIVALKQGSMGKLIKQLTKQEDPEVKGLASDLLGKWMAIFREGQAAKGIKPGEKPLSGSAIGGTEEGGAKVSSAALSKDKKEKSSVVEKKPKKDSKSKGGAFPPVEASQPPPGPLVALGKPKEKLLKRPRDLSLQKGQLPPPEKKSKISAADAKAKGPVESEGFMNFLSSQAAKMKEKRVKKISKPPPLSKSKSGNGDGGKLSGGGGNTPTSPDTPEAGSEGGQDDMVEGEEPAPASMKKRVSWAEEDNLCVVHYFQLDESERANVSHKSFVDAAQNEKLRERQALEAGLMFARDRLIEMASWRKPPVLEGALHLVASGSDSKQRVIQKEREEKVLAQLFLSKASLPPTPMEPDPEPEVEVTEPKLIPLLEPNAPPEMHTQPMAGPSGFISPSNMGPGPIPPDSPLQSPGSKLHPQQINFYESNNAQGMPTGPPHGPGSHLPPHGLPPPHMPYHGRDTMPPRGGRVNFYNANNNFDQPGFPPGPPGPPGPNLGQAPGPDAWNPVDGGGGGGYYGDQYYHGQSAPGLRQGGFHMRGRGYIKRGGAPGVDARICKHYLTHGCKLGNRCRFLHCSPEELANQMSEADHVHGRGGLLPPPLPQNYHIPPAAPSVPSQVPSTSITSSATAELEENSVVKQETVKQELPESMDISAPVNSTAEQQAS